MKRFLSSILVFVILLGCIGVSANSENPIAFITTQYNAVKCEGTMGMKLNKPLDVLDILFADDSETAPFDIKLLVENLLESKVKFEEKMIYQNDGKTLQAEANMDFNMPIVVNDSLSLDTNMKMSMWVDCDTQTPSNPIIKTIYKTPFDKRYMYMDYVNSIPEEQRGLFLMMIPTSSTYKIFAEQIANLVYANSTVKKAGNNITITISNNQLLSMISGAMKLFPENIGADEVIEALSSVQIFDDKAIVAEYTLDRLGRISKQNASINIKTNVYDIMQATGTDYYDIDREDAYIDFSLLTSAKYTYDNVKVSLPVLTEENSFNPYAPVAEEDYVSEYEYKYSACYINADNTEEYISYITNRKYPLRKIFEEIEIEGKYLYNNQIDVANGQIIISNPETDFNLTITEFSNIVNYNGQDIYLDAPVHEENGVCYITEEFLFKVFGLTPQYSSYHPYDETGSITYSNF